MKIETPSQFTFRLAINWITNLWFEIVALTFDSWSKASKVIGNMLRSKVVALTYGRW